MGKRDSGNKKKAKKSDSKSSGKNFSKDETLNLISIYGHPEIYPLFKSTKKHKLIYQMIAEEHGENGYQRTYKQVKNKLINLRREYNSKKPRSGESPPTWPFYAALHKIIGSKECYKDDKLIDSLDLDDDGEDESEDTDSSSSDEDDSDEDVIDKKKRKEEKVTGETSGSKTISDNKASAAKKSSRPIPK